MTIPDCPRTTERQPPTMTTPILDCPCYTREDVGEALKAASLWVAGNTRGAEGLETRAHALAVFLANPDAGAKAPALARAASITPRHARDVLASLQATINKAAPEGCE